MLKKIFAFLLGLVFVLLLFETILRVGHFSFASHLKESKLWGEKVILCLGNSHTYGAGAEEGFSYPEQLQKLFQNNYSKNIQVVNEGILGMNSAQLFASLEDKINFYKPSMVILQTGGPNYWNKQLYPFQDRVRRFELKTFQFVRYLWLTWDKSKEEKDEVLWSLFQDSQNMNKLPRTKINDQKALKLIEEFKKRLKDHPAASIPTAKLYEEYFHSYQEALEWYFWGIENIDESKHELVYELENYQSILRIVDQHDQDVALQAYYQKRLMEFSHKYPERLIRFKTLNQEELQRWVKFDLERIVHFLKKRNIEVILQTYPPAPPKGESIDNWANPLIREFAQKEGVILFDQEKELKALWRVGKEKPQDYYKILFNVYNSHLNEKGYGFVAQKLFELVPNSYK